MGSAIGGLFGVEKPKTQPIIPAPAPPPTVDQAQERQTTTDRIRFRRGAAATRLSSDSGGAGRVGVYKALGGS
jgi:hypothetical protein